MKREAWDHPKLKLLARDLRLPMFAVRGLMESVWLLAGINFPQGAIDWEPEELAVAIDYPDDAETMVEALLKRRLLDRLPDGRLYVHDWHVHADDAVHMKLARTGLRFANGSMPTLGRLSKEQRERALAKYVDEPTVRTDKPNVRTELHKSALPEPEPEPVLKKKVEIGGCGGKDAKPPRPVDAPSAPVPRKLDPRKLDPDLSPYLPAEYRTEHLSSVWREFGQHRRSLGVKPYQDVGIRKLASIMVKAELSPSQVPDVIEHCIASGWKGIPPDVVQRWPAQHPAVGAATNGHARSKTEQDAINRRAEEMAARG